MSRSAVGVDARMSSFVAPVSGRGVGGSANSSSVLSVNFRSAVPVAGVFVTAVEGHAGELVAGGHEHDPDTDARLRTLRRVISALPPLDRALMLLYLEERSQREIADVLGISESNVSTKVSRLKQRIREQF